MKPDKIKIEDLEVFANHGVFPEENVLGQKFVVSAVMYTDTRRAGLTDELTASIHYGEASAFITEYLKSHTFKLLEKVAEGLAEEMLVRIAGLQKVQIEIKKPWAPVGLPLKTVSVEIEREWHTAYIALGSNMGDSRSILEAAVQALDEEYKGGEGIDIYHDTSVRSDGSAGFLKRLSEAFDIIISGRVIKRAEPN